MSFSANKFKILHPKVFLIGGGRYGVKNHSHNYSRERRRLVSVKDALQLMLTFGNLIIALITLIVQLTNKK